MFLKPHNTNLNPPALVYRRFNNLAESFSALTRYKTSDNNYWIFNKETENFEPFDNSLISGGATYNTIVVTDFSSYFQYLKNYYYYNESEWVKTQSLPSGVTLLSVQFANIGKYQTNKYYYAGTIDYTIKGGESGGTTQYIKGNIIPFTSMQIKYFDDTMELKPDDLVVIDGNLYSVENPETTIKFQPRPFKIFFATLNNIL